MGSPIAAFPVPYEENQPRPVKDERPDTHPELVGGRRHPEILTQAPWGHSRTLAPGSESRFSARHPRRKRAGDRLGSVRFVAM